MTSAKIDDRKPAALVHDCEFSAYIIECDGVTDHYECSICGEQWDRDCDVHGLAHERKTLLDSRK